jgi:allantoate deiminase
MSAAAFSQDDLTRRLADLARFGADGGGVTRLVYDAAWCDAHAWFRRQAADLGLVATSDWAGNLLFHPPAVKPGDRQALLVGSHLDTVVRGGRLDGAYGAVTGLLIAASLAGRTNTPVIGFVTCEEEDSRFHAGLMGARALLGLVRDDEPAAAKDADGTSWEQALAFARGRGCAAVREGTAPAQPIVTAAAMVELHIEQGPILEAEEQALGIVTHIAGYQRWRVTLDGEARHAGTTPMHLRRDALAAAAELVLAVEALAKEEGGAAVATVGRLVADPGLFNVVPGRCEVWVEIRHTDSGTLARMAKEVRRRAGVIAEARRVGIESHGVSTQDPVPMSQGLVDLATKVAGDLGLTHRTLPSGAGHDAMVFAGAKVPSVMLFVPSQGGISHSPQESTADDLLFGGFRAGLELCTRVAGART